MLLHRWTGFIATVAITVLCVRMATAAEFDLNIRSASGKTLFFVVEATTQNENVLSDFKSSIINETLQNAKKMYPHWFSQYVVIGFDSTGVIYHNVTNDSMEVTSLLTTAYNRRTAYNGCDLPLLEAVMNGLSYYSFNPQSLVFLVTSAGASDQQLGPVFFKAAVGWQIELQYMLFNYPEITCNNSLSVPSVQFVANLAVTTNGNYIQWSTSYQLANYMFQYLPTLYNSLYIQTPRSSFSCLNLTYYAAVEPNVETVYLYLFGDSWTLGIQGPHTSVPPTTVVWNDQLNFIFSFTAKDGPGIYTINWDFLNNPFCNLQIRFQGNTSAETLTSTTKTAPTKPTTSTETLPSESTTSQRDPYFHLVFIFDSTNIVAEADNVLGKINQTLPSGYRNRFYLGNVLGRVYILPNPHGPFDTLDELTGILTNNYVDDSTITLDSTLSTSHDLVKGNVQQDTDRVAFIVYLTQDPDAAAITYSQSCLTPHYVNIIEIQSTDTTDITSGLANPETDFIKMSDSNFVNSVTSMLAAVPIATPLTTC